MYKHNFALQIPQELWEQLEKRCKRCGIAEFIRNTIKEKLDSERKNALGIQQ